MREDAHRWLRQGEADLRMARVSLEAAGYEWACFQAQQAAEKALKAFMYQQGYAEFTHSLTELVRSCGKWDDSFQVPELAEAAHFLDQFYIPTRYPNGLAGGIAPTEFYQRADAEKCVSMSELILRAVRKSFGK